MHIDLIVNADTPVRGYLPVFLIMVAVHIQDGHGGKCCQERKISWIQIAAGNDQINSRKLTLLKIIPQISRFFVRNRKYLHRFILTLLVLDSLLRYNRLGLFF